MVDDVKGHDGARQLKGKEYAKGPTSVLKPIENDLLKFTIELREQGFAVSISAVVIQVSQLMSEQVPTKIKSSKVSKCKEVDQKAQSCTQDGNT